MEPMNQIIVVEFFRIAMHPPLNNKNMTILLYEIVSDNVKYFLHYIFYHNFSIKVILFSNLINYLKFTSILDLFFFFFE